ncbi:MAG: hypothetical protein IPI63_00560 [Methanothrix sp.]|nr:hypothetical protein [Methanothrix sp.]MBK7385278.1 hypothetical protein [Methanothrix sp.]
MLSSSRGASPLLALPGVLASISSAAIGLLALLTSLASFGRQAEYGYIISPGAGGILFIHLALAGAVGMAIYLQRERGARGLQILQALNALISLLLFVHFREWAGCLFLIFVAAALYYSYLRNSSAPLLLSSGLIGFVIAQLAITTLPYGWKTWAIPGVLFLLAALISLLEGRLFLPGTGRGAGSGRACRLLYALFCALITFAVIALLMQVPHEAGPGLAGAARPGAALPLNPADDALPWGKIASPEDVRTFSLGESILFQARACEREPCQ